jgi:Domain of unknown function (DUF397)
MDYLNSADWRKSTKSGGNGGDCVEAATLRGIVAVRDSKDPHGPKLVTSPASWQAFTASVKAGLRCKP